MVSRAVSSRIPKNPGIPGLDLNPDPGICENKIPGFWYSTEDDVFRQLVGLFCTPRTFQSASNFCSTEPDIFYHLPINEDHEKQRKISAVDLLTNLIKEKTTSLILIGRLSKLKFLISLYDTVIL